MKKALIIVGVVVVLGTLITAAFAGGMVVGRFALSKPTAGPENPVPTVQIEQGAAPEEETGPEIAPPETDPPLATEETVEPTSDPSTRPVDAFNYDLLRTVLELIDEQYYGDIPDGQELAYGAIRGMLMTLDDPYTSFIEPEISSILNEDASGEFEGIGALVQMRNDGYLEVTSLIPDQPAEAAGVQAGDLIVAVGDQSIVGLGLYEAISYVRGPAGTVAELEIIRPGVSDPIFINVTRARIEIEIVESQMLENDIAYIRLTDFDATAGDLMQQHLEELLSQDPQGLIFDLRSNPGGYLSQAIEVADLFLDRGLIAIQRDSAGGEQRYSSTNGEIAESIPLVVLINGGSASASEIVAGAIQDRNRGPLIGTQTLGKGSVQLPNDLEDGSQLRVTIARWFTPNEQDLHGNGLTPDVEVDFPSETPDGEDPQLDAAIQYLIEYEP